jgi:hypothetical protein
VGGLDAYLAVDVLPAAAPELWRRLYDLHELAARRPSPRSA